MFTSEKARGVPEDANRQFGWTPLSEDHHDVWIAYILRREAASLILPDGSLEGKNTEATDADSRD